MLVHAMSLVATFNGLWLASLALDGFLFAILIYKRMWSRFPWFIAYCAWNFLETAFFYYFARKPAVYLPVYPVAESVSILLGLAIVYEVFKHLLSMHLALTRLAIVVFRGAVILLLLLAGAVIYAHLPLNFAHMGMALMAMEEAARVLEVGLLLFLFIFSSTFGLHWRQHEFGIALGLGILAAAKLTAVTVGQYAPSAGGMINLAFLLAMDISFLIWTGYLSLPEKIASSAVVPDRTQLEQWNQAIMELIHQ